MWTDVDLHFFAFGVGFFVCLFVCLFCFNLSVCLSVNLSLSVSLVSRRDFSGSSHTSDLKISTPVAILPGAWRYSVSTGTGRPGVSIL